MTVTAIRPEVAAEPSRPSRRRKQSRASFGSVRRLPSGRYQARYTDRQMNRHTAPQTFATKTAAEDWLATVRADVVRGTWRAPERGAITLADYARSHLATRADLAPRTQALYAEVLARWIIAPLPLPSHGRHLARTIDLGAVELQDLTVERVRQWHAAAVNRAAQSLSERQQRSEDRARRAATHAARRWAQSRGLDVPTTGRLRQSVLDAWHAAGSPDPISSRAPGSSGAQAQTGRAQVAQAYRLLRMICGQAVVEGRIDANPCQVPRAGQVASTERVPATPQEVAALAAAMPARYAAAVHLAAWSGLRAGELFALARRHFDPDEGTVRVERAVIYQPGCAPTIGRTKTESSKRTVHLPPHVVVLLQQHMESYAAPGRDALIFTDPAGRIVPSDVRKAPWRKARASVGRPDLRWHDLRHTGATLAAQAGASLAELQHRFGHSTVTAAMIYQHSSHERDRVLAARLGRLADGTGTESAK